MHAKSGILVINKSTGMTSRDVVNRLQWLMKRATRNHKQRLGHCGTLDRMATGVLVVCIGQARRLVTMVQEFPKHYSGEFILGRSTDTDDITGRLIRDVDLTDRRIARTEIETLLPEFEGEVHQVPPLFSAVHVDGQRAYKRAKKGQQVELDARPVMIHNISLERFEQPCFQLHVECATGTYIRSIGRDIGERLGCGATMSQLVRTSIGHFTLDDAVPLEMIDEANIVGLIRSPLEGVVHLRWSALTDEQTWIVRTGRALDLARVTINDATNPLSDTDTDARVVLRDANDGLIGLGEEVPDEGALKPIVILNAAGAEFNRR